MNHTSQVPRELRRTIDLLISNSYLTFTCFLSSYNLGEEPQSLSSEGSLIVDRHRL